MELNLIFSNRLQFLEATYVNQILTDATNSRITGLQLCDRETSQLGELTADLNDRMWLSPLNTTISQNLNWLDRFSQQYWQEFALARNGATVENMSEWIQHDRGEFVVIKFYRSLPGS